MLHSWIMQYISPRYMVLIYIMLIFVILLLRFQHWVFPACTGHIHDYRAGYIYRMCFSTVVCFVFCSAYMYMSSYLLCAVLIFNVRYI